MPVRLLYLLAMIFSALPVVLVFLSVVVCVIFSVLPVEEELILLLPQKLQTVVMWFIVAHLSQLSIASTAKTSTMSTGASPTSGCGTGCYKQQLEWTGATEQSGQWPTWPVPNGRKDPHLELKKGDLHFGGHEKPDGAAARTSINGQCRCRRSVHSEDNGGLCRLLRRRLVHGG